jgi:hypothetical protein
VRRVCATIDDVLASFLATIIHGARQTDVHRTFRTIPLDFAMLADHRSDTLSRSDCSRSLSISAPESPPPKVYIHQQHNNTNNTTATMQAMDQSVPMMEAVEMMRLCRIPVACCRMFAASEVNYRHSETHVSDRHRNNRSHALPRSLDVE